MRCPQCHRRLSLAGPCPRDGALVEAAPLRGTLDMPELPQVQGLAVLGAGGFGTVFAGRDRAGREVAVKLAHRPGDRRFEREAEALRAIGPPAAPALYDGDVTPDGRSYLIEERLHGQTLAEALAALPGEGAMPPVEVEALGRSICRAVAAVHEAGFVHRDLKPENVFLRSWGGEERVVTLLDFGLARPLAAGGADDPRALLTLTRTGQQLGSSHYMAPEQLADPRRADQRADVYALGAVLYECLTGRPPFVGDDTAIRHAHAARRPAPPSRWVAAAGCLDAVILRCLAKEPAQRHATAAELAAAMAAAVTVAVPEEPAAAPEARAAASLRTVGLLGVRSSLPLTELATAAEREGGQVARARDDGYLLMFPHRSARAAVRAGLRAGRTLWPHLEPTARLLLHAAELRVREGDRGARAVGPALDAPGDWWPAGAHERAGITAAAAALLDGATFTTSADDTLTAAPLGEPPAPPPAIPVVGREPLLQALQAEADQAFREARPGVTTLVGEVGFGKTCLLEAMAERLHGRARVVRVQFQSPEAAGTESATALLCRTALPSSGDRPALGRPREALARAIADGLRPAAPTALLIDDAQWADPCALDALELAATEAGAPLWVLAGTTPELFDRRPTWGERAVRHSTHRLGPLGAEAERALLRALLAPAELIPTDLLQLLEGMARGIPRFAVEIAGALRAAGAIRRSAGTEGWYLAGDELLAVSSTPLAARLAHRLLGPAPPALRAFAELCAVLGDGFSHDEAILVERAVSAAEHAAEPLDPQVGLERLSRLGVLRAGPDGRWQFRHPLLRAAIEESMPAPRRRQLHRLVLTALLEHAGGALPRAVIARHAALCGAHEEAFHSHFHLAEEARATFHYQEADENYTAALAQLDDGDPRRGRVLAGRAKVRHPVQRFADALSDLAASRPHVEAGGDPAAIADLLLEEATVLDWSEGWIASAERVAQARPFVERSGHPGLRARWLMALGRTRYREEKLEEAARHLAAGQAAARVVGDHETWAIATMLLGMTLVSAGRLDEAEARFDEVIDSCERAGDTLHLCSAYNNRIFLWLKRESLERAIADQRRATALAREIAHVQLERMSTFNLAELLFWRGDLPHALALALRARELQTRFLDEVPLDALLVARLRCALALWGSQADLSAAARGEQAPLNSAVREADPSGPAGQSGARAAHLQEARRELEWVLARCPPERRPPLVQTQVRLLELLTGGAAGGDTSSTWRALVEEARRTAVAYELQEIVHFAAAAALREGRLTDARHHLDEGAALAGPTSLWRDRFAGLPAAVASEGSPASQLAREAPSASHPGQSAIHDLQGDIDDPAPVDLVDRSPADGALV